MSAVDGEPLSGPSEAAALIAKAKAVSAGAPLPTRELALGKSLPVRFASIVTAEQLASGARLLDDNRVLDTDTHVNNPPPAVLRYAEAAKALRRAAPLKTEEALVEEMTRNYDALEAGSDRKIKIKSKQTKSKNGNINQNQNQKQTFFVFSYFHIYIYNYVIFIFIIYIYIIF